VQETHDTSTSSTALPEGATPLVSALSLSRITRHSAAPRRAAQCKCEAGRKAGTSRRERVRVAGRGEGAERGEVCPGRGV